jgi:hypothetical protein
MTYMQDESIGPTVDEVIDRAADILDRDGWCRGAYVNGLGEHCVTGALNSVLNAFTQDLRKWDEVSDFIRSPGVLPTSTSTYRHITLAKIVMWNDRKCANRYEATNFLRSEAKRYREENS